MNFHILQEVGLGGDRAMTRSFFMCVLLLIRLVFVEHGPALLSFRFPISNLKNHLGIP